MKRTVLRDLLGVVWVGWAGLAGAQSLLPGERAASIAPIPGVIAANATWELVWADFETADGIVATPDGGVLFAQEQTDTLRKLDAQNRETIFLSDTHGAGAVSVDAQGRMFVVQRTCTDPGKPFSASCAELTRISQVAPEQRLLANAFADGRPLGRLNDLIADGKGGAYFTVDGAYHVSAAGVVSAVENRDLTPNGIQLSADGRRLFVTNAKEVLVFDVQPDGSTRNRRVFGNLEGDQGADGMAFDAEGRLYVTARGGVHVLSKDGAHLGLIPTPRAPITLAFSGADKRTLYVPMMGAIGPDGKAWATPQGVRNTAMTIYRIPMLSQGLLSRPK
ncbi:MAG: SMP-30/gluconolactonase/LRE family protein [Steroidobacteraceae bacterium]